MRLERLFDQMIAEALRRGPEEQARIAATALEALRDHLLEEAEAPSPRTVLEFLLRQFPREVEPDEATALALLEGARSVAERLVERNDHSLAAFLPLAERLRDDLPRALGALALLRESAGGAELGAALELDDPEGLLGGGAVSAGVNAIHRPSELNYGAAEMDEFEIITLDARGAMLQTPQREALGEPALGPVRLPPPVAALLRPGDKIDAEIAPGEAGWEIVEAAGVIPGGYL